MMGYLQLPELHYEPFLIDNEDEEKFFTEFATSQYDLILENGYVTRTLKPKYHESILYEKKEFFHRWLMKEKLNKIPQYQKQDIQIHHKDGNKLNNKKENLILIETKEHFRYHKGQRYRKAYQTRTKKVYGDCEEYDDRIEEFERWLEEKEEENESA